MPNLYLFNVRNYKLYFCHWCEYEIIGFSSKKKKTLFCQRICGHHFFNWANRAASSWLDWTGQTIMMPPAGNSGHKLIISTECRCGHVLFVQWPNASHPIAFLRRPAGIADFLSPSSLSLSSSFFLHSRTMKSLKFLANFINNNEQASVGGIVLMPIVGRLWLGCG